MLSKKYHTWIDNHDFYYQRFDFLALKLEHYLLDYVLTDKTYINKVARNFLAVLQSCDEIDYQDNETATAYGILHFLPRYHRFQLIFENLIDRHILPLNTKNPINSLDIGTGPGPSLFALSDAYLSLKLFGESEQLDFSKNLQYIPDYVERSSGFRDWLHQFTEIANHKLHENTFGWIVPYHHGNFHDFENIQFNEDYSYWDVDDDGDDVKRTAKIKYRFNIILASNFLTTLDQVTALEAELQNCMRFIRNKGKLIICGGTGKIDRNKNYPAIYQKVKDILLDDVYSNELFYAKCNYIDISRNKLSFFYNDRFGNRIKEFNKRIIKRFEEFNSLKKIPDIAREIFLNSISDEYAYESKWEYHIFEKFARLKKPIPGYMKKRHLVSKIQAMPFPSGIGNHFQ